MRPHSEVRMDLAAALVEGGGTTRQLAQRTGWGLEPTRRALGNMLAAGDVERRLVRVPGVRRPVPFYVRALRQRERRAADECPLVSLIAAWARPGHGLTAGAAGVAM